MRRLALSMARFGLASTLLGAEQMASLVRPRSAAHRRHSLGALDAVSRTAGGELGAAARMAVEAGVDLQREWLDLASGAVTPDRFGDTVAGVARRSADALSVARPDRRGTLVRRELRNKLEVYRLVRIAQRKLDLPPAGEPFPLGPYLDRALARGDYESLWAVEGLGHEFGSRLLRHGARRGEEPKGLLTDALSELDGAALGPGTLAPSTLAMLHAGFGLATAELLLEDVDPEDLDSARRAVRAFVRICRGNCQDTHLDVALEALGLMARCFFPASVGPMARALADGDDRTLERYFWHGVGRAVYFLPVQFLPGYGSLANALDLVAREAPEGPLHGDAVMGLSFAFCLVNLSDPEVLEGALRLYGDATDTAPFADGFAAAMVMRRRMTPESDDVAEVLAHRPGADVEERWLATVVEPYRRRWAAAEEAGTEGAEDGYGGRAIDVLYPDLDADLDPDGDPEP
ncbi:MAG: hypothetical protein AAGN66_09190 [Acidobacteriota bacterium]